MQEGSNVYYLPTLNVPAFVQTYEMWNTARPAQVNKNC